MLYSLRISHSPTQFSIFLSEFCFLSIVYIYSHTSFSLSILHSLLKFCFLPQLSLTVFHSLPQFLVTPTILFSVPQLFIIGLDTKFCNYVLKCVFLLPMSFLKLENIKYIYNMYILSCLTSVSVLVTRQPAYRCQFTHCFMR